VRVFYQLSFHPDSLILPVSPDPVGTILNCFEVKKTRFYSLFLVLLVYPMA
jgi:hypothetical protein